MDVKGMIRIVVGAVALALVAGAPAPADAADAAALWKKDCSKCHGSDGKGDTKIGKKMKVQDMTTAEWQSKNSDAQIVKDTKEGKGEPDEDGEKPMPAYPKYSEEQLKALLAHMRSFKK